MTRRKGLTLIEILVALTMLTLVGAAVSSAMISSFRVNRESRINTAAQQVAQSVLERYRAYWNSTGNYEEDPVSAATNPSLADLEAQLPAGLTLSVNPQGKLSPDGTSWTPTGITPANNPPVRQVVVRVLEGTKVRARLETRVGRP